MKRQRGFPRNGERVAVPSACRPPSFSTRASGILRRNTSATRAGSRSVACAWTSNCSPRRHTARRCLRSPSDCAPTSFSTGERTHGRRDRAASSIPGASESRLPALRSRRSWAAAPWAGSSLTDGGWVVRGRHIVPGRSAPRTDRSQSGDSNLSATWPFGNVVGVGFILAAS